MGDVALLLIATDSPYSRILSVSVIFCWSRLTRLTERLPETGASSGC